MQARALSPRAAKFAERLLNTASSIPYEVRLSMRIALLEQIHHAKPPTDTEWSSLERPIRSKDARTHSDVIEARLFVKACEAFAARHW